MLNNTVLKATVEKLAKTVAEDRVTIDLLRSAGQDLVRAVDATRKENDDLKTQLAAAREALQLLPLTPDQIIVDADHEEVSWEPERCDAFGALEEWSHMPASIL